jgi:hypothetical protein
MSNLDTQPDRSEFVTGAVTFVCWNNRKTLAYLLRQNGLLREHAFC